MAQDMSEPELIFCAAVEQRVSRDDCDDLNAASAQVREGAGAFNVPDPMQRGQSTSVQLVIDRRSPEEIAAIEALPSNGLDASNEAVGVENDNSSAGPETSNTVANTQVEAPVHAHRRHSHRPTPNEVVQPLPGRTEDVIPQVGRFMRAELVGQGFRVVPRTPASQEIPPGGQATWIWEVTALEAGLKTLTLTTAVEGVVGTRHYQLANTQTIRRVTVSVSWPDRIKDWLRGLPDWLKLIAGVLSALGILVGAWFALRAKFPRSGK